ncbi:hypothetical protein V865_007412 [Kwoniella europaea PYCC6329]|uniref:Uncharacterized protein n=1 Tax=Kwoniella europaea PYCC6329 TaxID=1423913 RepID=A0AAX4KSU1_9TREE
MPRSPSPPPRGGYRRSYRDESPPWAARERDDFRYRGESSRYREYDRRDPREEPGYGSRGGYGYGRDREYDYDSARRRGGSPLRRSFSVSSRDYEYDPSPPKSRRSRSRSRSKSRSRSRTGTPEEGQITSPLPSSNENAPAAVKSSSNPAGLPPRPRSPPPPISSRRRSRSPPPYRGYARERERERDWRDRDRDRDYYYRRSRSPYSPPPVRRRGGRSPSIVSSISTRSPSSRPSPVKRYQSRSRSPERPPRQRSRFPSPAPVSTPITPAPPPRPIPVAVPLSNTSIGKPMLNKIPPSAPRSERLPIPGLPPTGPRALAHLNTPIPVPLGRTLGMNRSIPPTAPAPVVKEEIRPSPSTPSAGLSDPSKAPPAAEPSTGVTGTPRLSWSERKTLLSPSTSTSINQSNTPEPTKISPTPTPTPGPVVINPYTGKPFGQARAAAAQGNSSPAAPSTPSIMEDIKPKIDEIDARPPTPPVIHQDTKPSTEPTPVLTRPNPPTGPSHRTSLAPVPVPVPVVNEAELAERKAKEEESRILAELPSLKVPFGGLSWEIELSNYNHRMIGLSNNTLRAQSAARHAAMILADAEAERIAAGERRKICEDQLLSFSVGIIPGV